MQEPITFISEEQFRAFFQSRTNFLKTLRRSIVPFNSADTRKLGTDRKTLIASLYELITAGNYHPQNPRERIAEEKHNGVPRFMYSLSVEDACVYYFCMSSLVKYAVLNRAKNTFAGLEGGGPFRQQERNDFNALEEERIVDEGEYPFWNSIDPTRSRRIWKEYRRAAILMSRDRNLQHFVHLDIANFYDSINLDLLERQLRSVVHASDQPIIELLFTFLRNWNRRVHWYAPKTVGLPTEEIDDCSRMFANFYLQAYDAVMKASCSGDSMTAQFLRYSDDQWIMTEDRSQADRLLFRAAEELQKMGLSINSSKVLHFDSREEFAFYWGEQIFEPLDLDGTDGMGEFATRAFEQFDWDEQTSTRRMWKREYAENMLLWHFDHPQLTQEQRQRIFEMALSQPYIGRLHHAQMQRISDYVEPASGEEFIKALEYYDRECLFNRFHLHYNKFKAILTRQNQTLEN